MPRSKKQDINKTVDQAIQNFTDQVDSGELKLSVADFVRLMEFKKQQEKSTPKKISVKWVDEWTDSFRKIEE